MPAIPEQQQIHTSRRTQYCKAGDSDDDDDDNDGGSDGFNGGAGVGELQRVAHGHWQADELRVRLQGVEPSLTRGWPGEEEAVELLLGARVIEHLIDALIDLVFVSQVTIAGSIEESAVWNGIPEGESEF